MAQGDLNPIDDTTPRPEAADERVELTFEKFSSFVEEYRPNISLGGMFLATNEPKPIGATIACDFKLTDGFRLCQALGEVVWIRRQDGGPEAPAGVGIRFQAIDDKGRELVLKILEEQVKSGGEPFEVEQVPPDAEGAAAPAAPSPGEDPASTMSRPAWPVTSPEEDPASTHPRPAVTAEAAPDGFGSAPWGEELPDVPQEVITGAFEVEADPVAAEPDISFEADAFDIAAVEPVESAPVDELSFGMDESPSFDLDADAPELAFDEDPALPSVDASSPAPEPDFSFETSEDPAFSFGEDALDAEPPAATAAAPPAPASVPATTPPAGLPEGLGFPILKEEPSGAWDLDAPADMSGLDSGPDIYESPPDLGGIASTNEPEAAVESDDLLGDDSFDSSFNDDDGLGGDPLAGLLPETPVTDTSFLETGDSFGEDDDEWDDDWDDDEDAGGGRFGNLKAALQESMGRILLVVVVLAVAGAGWFFKDQILALAGFGPSPQVSSGTPPTATPPPSVEPPPESAPAAATDLGEELPEEILAELPEDSAAGLPPVEVPAEVPPPETPIDTSPAMDPVPEPVPPPPPPVERPSPPPSSASGRSATAVREITFQQTSGGTLVTVLFDGQMPVSQVEHNELSYDPLKEQIVLHGIRSPYRSRIDAGTLELDRIRTGLHGTQLNLVFDFSSDVMTVADVQASGDRLELTVRRR